MRRGGEARRSEEAKATNCFLQISRYLDYLDYLSLTVTCIHSICICQLHIIDASYSYLPDICGRCQISAAEDFLRSLFYR